jgi:hypothetical protein
LIITEQEIVAFFLGAGLGSIVTYWNATRETRFVSRVRLAIDLLHYEHKLALTPAQYQKISNPAQIATYDEIVSLRPWADRIGQNFRKRRIKSPLELHPVTLVAEAMICKNLLGLPYDDAINALRSAKTREDLGPLTATLLCKKAILERIDSVVLPALNKFDKAENALIVAQAMSFRHERGEFDAERREVMLAAAQATNELHDLSEFARKEKFAYLVLGGTTDVSSAIEARCKPSTDVSLLRDIAEAFKRRTNATVVAADKMPISISFSRTRTRLEETPRLDGPFDEIVIADRSGETRPLSSITHSVFDAWMGLIRQPPSPSNAGAP